MPAEPIFLIDNNISHRIAAALADLEQPFRHLSAILPQNTPDVDLFSELGARGWFLVTQDEKITRKPHERQAMVNAGIGAFIYTGKAVKSNVEMMQLVLEESTRDAESRCPHDPAVRLRHYRPGEISSAR